MSETKAINDATLSIVGTPYQLCIAIKRCYDMGPANKVFIETHGDVTLKSAESKQFEVKHYAGPLTDSGENFWKTLYNWLQDHFPSGEFASLVLVTTQTIGADSRLKGWNGATVDAKVAILEAIYVEAKQREAERAKDEKPTPKIYKHQEYCLASSRRDRLKAVIAKYVIASDEPDILDLNEDLKRHHARGMLQGKQQDFIDGLIGFLLSPTRILATGGWVVTNEEFDAKTQELTAKYQKETRVFPVDCLKQPQGRVDDLLKDDPLFLKKIKEIEHHVELRNAAQDYLYAKETIGSDITKYEMYPEAVSHYQEAVETDFRRKHRIALAEFNEALGNLVQAQIFYDKIVTDAPLPFGTFGSSTNQKFRNGVIHIHMQDDVKAMKWRLK